MRKTWCEPCELDSLLKMGKVIRNVPTLVVWSQRKLRENQERSLAKDTNVVIHHRVNSLSEK